MTCGADCRVEELLWCTPHEFFSLCAGQTVSTGLQEELALRRERSVWFFTPDGYEILVDAQLAEQVQRSLAAQGGEVRGLPTSAGVVEGVVRIVLSEKDFGKVQPGDILVTSMTRPEFLPVMRLAAAFVTNEGSVACHAAVVARELGKPCITGTRDATSALRDGMRVRVDADKGKVSVLDQGR